MNIAVINESKSLSQRELGAWIHAVEYQVKRHFQPTWALSAELRLVPRGKSAKLSEFKIVILDSPADAGDAGYYGYHECDDQNKPMAYVFLDTIKADGRIPSVVFSHEVLEMILDPLTWSVALTPYKSMRVVSVEACDPVQMLGYDIDGVHVSDFVTPDYFVARSDGPWDHLGYLEKPLSIYPGGYLLCWTQEGGWGEKSASSQETGKKHAFSRTRQIMKSGTRLMGKTKSR